MINLVDSLTTPRSIVFTLNFSLINSMKYLKKLISYFFLKLKLL